MASYQNQQSQEQRPPHIRAKSGSFSFLSQKSDGDKPKSPKVKLDLHETEREKMKSKFNSKAKANPNQALKEDQPMIRAQGETNTLLSLRGGQYKDWQGNVITDPDLSNPVRPRLERPLDTIRSFEAAIDGGHRQRAKLLRAESAGELQGGYSSRRSSMHGSDFNVNPRSTLAISSPYYGSAQSSRRAASYQRDPYDRSPVQGPPSAYPKRSGMGQRMVTAPAFSRQQYMQDYNPQPSSIQQPQSHHAYYDSFDATAESSNTSEPWTNSTDPSSENSSIDRIHAARFSTEGDAYGSSTPYGRSSPGKSAQNSGRQTPGAIAEETYHPSGYQGQYNYEQGVPFQGQPHVPAKDIQQPMPARTSSNGPRGPTPQAHRSAPQQYSQQYRQPAHNVTPSTSGPQAGYQSQQQQQQQQTARQGHPDAGRPNALRKKLTDKPPEKRQSWLKRTFSRA